VGSKVIRNVTKIIKATSGRLFGRVTSGTGRGEELTPSDVRTLISFDESVDDRVSALLAAGANITITYNDASNTLTIASTSGGLSGTGSVDNAALRADGTGNATLQNSAWVINDNLTASPNNTVNHACLEATGGTTDVSVSIKPKGAGAFCLTPPDGTSTGGDVRGSNAIDLQRIRSNANQVASGANSFVSGKRNRASGSNSAAWGDLNVCSGTDTTSFGVANTVTAQYAVGYGSGNTVGGYASSSFGNYGTIAGTADGASTFGYYARADSVAQLAWAGGFFSSVGDCQTVRHHARVLTTAATLTELGVYWSIGKTPTNKILIPAGKVMSALVRITGIKSDGSETIKLLRDVTIKNVGGTTSLETAPVTIGTDINVSAATLTLEADNGNDSLRIAITPPSGTWRWAACVDGLETAYGT
jgi:hypothetical protein